ncbi:MAG: 23S rRNA (pseudouridine(1915)-N(3))-methyltransferase RlmH [Anaerovoracaceae bacterium]|jgi:23S rRNA (pseudouridine1915-N3)-methyltransferase
MKIRILCVGKLKERYWREASAEYMKRLSPYCDLTVEEIKESPSDSPEEEGEAILKKIKKEETVFTLEIEGRSLSSEAFAEKINSLAIEGKKSTVFVIGGSEGLSKEVQKRSDMALSFSDMTFPHQMMRVILLEQIYRSFKIIRGETYHK